MLEDGVKHRAGTLHEPLDVLVVLAVDVRNEEEFFSSPSTMNREKCTVPRSSCALAKSGMNAGSSSASALALAGALIGKSMTR